MRILLHKAGIAPRTIRTFLPLNAFVGVALRTGCISSLADERTELIDGHVPFAYGKRPADRHHVLRPLIAVAVLLAARRSHREAACRNHHHLRATITLPERILRLQSALLRRRQRR